MQAGALTTGSVKEWTSRVLVDGVARPHVSWSLDRELTGDLPAQVIAGSGLSQATGSIVWASTDPVVRAGENPWNTTMWWAKKGARVEIWCGDGVTEWRQFYGVIDRTTGTLGGSLQSRIIDEVDLLSTKISHDPLLRSMPPHQPGGAFRHMQLAPSYHLDYAMRQAGFNTTPRQEPNTVVLAPMVGGAWPHIGVLTGARSFESASTPPTNMWAPWGFAMGDAILTYQPTQYRPASDKAQITLMVGPDHAALADVTVFFSSGDYIRLSVGADRSVQAQKLVGGQFQEVATLSAARMSGAQCVSMLWAGGALSLRNDKGETQSTVTGGPSGTTTTVEVSARPGAVVGGLMVNHPDTAAQEHRSSKEWGNPTDSFYRRRAVIDTLDRRHLSVIYAAPAVLSRTAQSVIDEISEALLAACWIDENGVMRWTSGTELRGRPAVKTITTRDDVLALAWEDSLLGARSSVTVTYREPSITGSSWRQVEVWRGSATRLSSGDFREDIITPGADESWIDVDPFFRAVGALNASIYNEKRGSYMGFSFTKDGDYYPPGDFGQTYGYERIGPQAWKLTHTMGTLPAGVVAETRLPDVGESAPGLWSWLRNDSLPLVAAGAKVQWLDGESYVPSVNGLGPALEHDVGPWAAHDIADLIAAYLAGQTAAPMPTVTDLEIDPDPRLQLGDRVWIDSPGLMGVRLLCMISSASLSYSRDGGLVQSVGLRIMTSTVYEQDTYKSFNSEGAAIAYGPWNQLVAETYTQFNIDGGV